MGVRRKFNNGIAFLKENKLPIAFICFLVIVGCLLCIRNGIKNDIIMDQQAIITSQTKKINEFITKVQNLEEKVQNLQIQQQSSTNETQEPRMRSLGIFEITAYCPCHLCSPSPNGTTATGTIVQAGRTIGVNPNTISYGSKVSINGHEFIAEDTGSAAQSNAYLIDIFMNTHQEALAFGKQHMEVFLIE